MRTVQVKAPRGPLKLDAYDNPIQNVYVSKVQKVKDPVLGEVLVNVPVKTYTGGVAVLDLVAGRVPQAGPVQALAARGAATGAAASAAAPFVCAPPAAHASR